MQFVDFRKVFDSVDRDKVFEVLLHYRTSSEIATATVTLYIGSISMSVKS